jgi:hypothetical protein
VLFICYACGNKSISESESILYLSYNHLGQQKLNPTTGPAFEKKKNFDIMYKQMDRVREKVPDYMI